MAFIVRYIKQEHIDNMERWSGRKMSAEDIEARKNQVKVESKAGAERLVEHLRLTGHLASYYDEFEL